VFDWNVRDGNPDGSKRFGNLADPIVAADGLEAERDGFIKRRGRYFGRVGHSLDVRDRDAARANSHDSSIVALSSFVRCSGGKLMAHRFDDDDIVVGGGGWAIRGKLRPLGYIKTECPGLLYLSLAWISRACGRSDRHRLTPIASPT